MPCHAMPCHTILTCMGKVYSFEADLLLSMGIAKNPRIIRKLRECLKANDPPPEEIISAYNSKFKKTVTKTRIMKALG